MFIRYHITDLNYYTNNIDIFQNRLNSVISKQKIDFISLRDKISSNIEELAQVFVSTLRDTDITTFISSNIQLAKKYNFDGVHLTSTQFNQINEAKNQNLQVIVSCHNINDILLAQQFRADYATISPIFQTPNKGKPMGINGLKDIVNDSRITISLIALGGIIDDRQIRQIQQINISGFASIRYFLKD